MHHQALSMTTIYIQHTLLLSNCQGITLSPLIPTVDTAYSDVVLIVCHKTSQFILCDTGIGDVQKSPIWCIRSIGGNVDEVEVSTVCTTQCPTYSDILSSTDIIRESNTGEIGDRGGT